MSGPGVSAQAGRASEAGEGLAWALAASPLAVALLLMALFLLGVVDDARALSVLSLAASAALVVADRRGLTRSGRAADGALPSVWWFLVPPVYLWRRATCLGRSRAQAWAWAACAALAFAIRVAVLVAAASDLAGAREASMRLPGCADRDVAADVRGVFDDLPAARQDGVRAVSLGAQAEVGQGPGAVPLVRYCSGTMLATDDVEYDVDYSFERRREDVIVRLQIRPGR